MVVTDSKAVAGLALPVIQVIADNMAQGWEEAVLATWQMGAEIKTQYDKPEDPPSRDCSMVITIADPLAEPRIHRAMPGGIGDLESYRQEVVDGIRDHWIDPVSGKWQYSYHERICAYKAPGIEQSVNQLEYIIDALVEQPYTRQAQAVLWQPWRDAGYKYPCCLQRIWFRILGDELVANFHMRSNDAFKAAFMNIYAFTDLQRYVAEKISERTGRTIRVGQYTHYADSFHIYGSYFDDFKGFLGTVQNRTWEKRTYRTEDVQELIDEAKVEIAAALAKEKEEINRS